MTGPEQSAAVAVDLSPLDSAAATAESASSGALRGVPWNLGAFALSRGVQLVGTLVIARLVAPTEVGVVLTGMLIVAVLNLIADNGLAISLVVTDRIDQRLVDTVLGMMLAIAIVGAALASALASPIAALFDSPQLADILPLLSLTVITGTVAWLLTNLLQREMLWQARFAGQLTLAFAYVVVAVPAAALGAGAWSMVAGQLVAGALACVVLWRAYPQRLRPRLHRPEAARALHESRPYISQSFTTFTIENVHLLAVALLLGPHVMALYAMSYRLADLPGTALGTPVAEATLPAYVKLRDDRERSNAILFTVLRYVALGAFLPLGILVAVSPDFVSVILGASWTEMTPILVLLCVRGTFSVPVGTLAWFINAGGGARFIATMTIVRLCLISPLVFVAAAVIGTPEAVAAVMCADIVIELIPLTIYAHRRLALPYSGVLRTLRLPIAAAGAALAVGLALRATLTSVDVADALRLVIAVAGAACAYLAVVLTFDRHIVLDGRRLTGRALAR